MEIDIIFLILIFVLGWVMGEIFMIQKIRRICIDHGFDIDEEVTNSHIEKFMAEKRIFSLETEEVDDTILLYDRDTKTFLCQGSTLEELAVKAKEQKNIEYAAVYHTDKMFIFLRGVVAEKVVEKVEVI
jgi:hypothetical protein